MASTPPSSRSGAVDVLTTAGDLLTQAAAGVYSRLAIGGAGQVLTVAAGLPSWANAPGGRTLLSDTVLAIDTATIDVSGLSQSYVHLELIAMVRGTAAATNTTLLLRLNADGGATYYSLVVLSNNSTTLVETIGGTSAQVGYMSAANGPANDFSIARVLIPFYAGAAALKHSTADGEVDSALSSTNVFTYSSKGTWNSVAAVTQVTLLPGAGSFKAASRLMVYGLA
jgi:hypothetical protein